MEFKNSEHKFSKYKYILGIPGKGFHKPHILGTAIYDYIKKRVKMLSSIT